MEKKNFFSAILVCVFYLVSSLWYTFFACFGVSEVYKSEFSNSDFSHLTGISYSIIYPLNVSDRRGQMLNVAHHQHLIINLQPPLWPFFIVKTFGEQHSCLSFVSPDTSCWKETLCAVYGLFIMTRVHSTAIHLTQTHTETHRHNLSSMTRSSEVDGELPSPRLPGS